MNYDPCAEQAQKEFVQMEKYRISDEEFMKRACFMHLQMKKLTSVLKIGAAALKRQVRKYLKILFGLQHD